MTDTAAIEEQPQDLAPVETPASAETPEPSLDDLLAEFDRETAKPEPAADPVGQETIAPDQSVDQQLADLLRDPADQRRIDQLTADLDGLRAAEYQRLEREDFEKFSSALQGHCGPNVPDDYAKTQLLAMAAQDPNLEVAWRYRNLTREQLAAADRVFQELQVLHWKAQQAPDDPRKAQAMAAMERRGQELGLMMNARTILTNARRDVLKRAEKVLPPIDIEQTQLHMEVAAAVRGQSEATPPADPPIPWSRLDTQTFRRTVREKFGYDPGV